MAGNKENMKQAMKELLGLVGLGPEGGGGELNPEQVRDAAGAAASVDLKQQQQEVAETVEKGFFGGRDRQDERHFDPREEETVRESAPFGAMGFETPAAPTFAPDASTTVISTGTSLFGDIRSEGTVEVHGKLKGNLEATGSVRITGKVLGDVKGDCVVLAGCAVQGNITATATVRIDQSTVVVGDIVADSLVTDGKVKGNVQVEHTAAFQKNAVLAGNVAAGLVSMCEGAKVQGSVRISQDSETNSLFGENLDI